jgi:hypothetical protein
MFGWWFGLPEPYPRGQRSAVMMLSEIGVGGDWAWAFQAPHLDKYNAPTVEGIDYPSIGVRQAWNDAEAGVLHVATYAVTPDRRGADTTWRVTDIPSTGGVTVRVDGQPFDRFEVEGPGTIRLDAEIGEHRYEIFTGYRSPGSAGAQARREASGRTDASAVLAASRASTGSIAAGVRPADGGVVVPPPPTCACC